MNKHFEIIAEVDRDEVEMDTDDGLERLDIEFNKHQKSSCVWKEFVVASSGTKASCKHCKNELSVTVSNG